MAQAGKQQPGTLPWGPCSPPGEGNGAGSAPPASAGSQQERSAHAKGETWGFSLEKLYN